MSTKKTQKSFSDVFKELEEITEWFENDKVDLETGLVKFERGLELAGECKKMLKNIENKVEEIKKKFEV
jgi:exodeoxyribonuclease VII small subunit